MNKGVRTSPVHPFMPRSSTANDPLTAALQPPPNESQAERDGRVRAEQEAKKRSDNIDRMLRVDQTRLVVSLDDLRDYSPESRALAEG